MKRRPIVVLLVLALAGGSTPASSAPRVVVVFGDSLTAGFGLTQEEAYPARLGARLRADGFDYRVVNAGVSGDTTAGGLRRVDWALRLNPDVVVVALGGNDGLRGLDLATTRANLAAIVERFQAAGAKILLAGMRLPPNYGGDYAGRFARMYETVARERGVPLMPFLLDGVGGKARLNQPDGIHPTAEGQRIIADRVWPHLRPLLNR
ncbi:MAG TPA: arylesterase [Candidatus Limnocylindrales bacterium]|nr:arylesterase [Candidatus Limnocylindrales bacterium]